MSAPEPLNDSSTSSPLQRLAIILGTLVVIILTILAAVVLALRDLPQQEATPTVAVVINPAVSPPPVFTPTSLVPTPLPAQPTETPSPTPSVVPSQTPSATSTPTLEPTPTPLPPTDTPTPVFTPTPQVIIVTATPLPQPPVAAPPPPAGRTVCQPPPDWVPYVVQLGDTLNSLALRTNSSVYELQQVNCLEIFTLEIGQTIYLPFTPPTPTITYTPTPRTPTPPPSRTGTPTLTPRPPEIFSNFPESGHTTEEVIMAVQGRNFEPDTAGFRVELRTGGTREILGLGELRTTTSFEAIVPAGLSVNTYDLWVINPDDQFDIRSSAYAVLPPP
jgi:LysM repeat protein